MGISTGDIDRDGDFDIYVTNLARSAIPTMSKPVQVFGVIKRSLKPLPADLAAGRLRYRGS